MPWGLGAKRRELLQAAATQFEAMNVKTAQTTKTLEKFVGTQATARAVSRSDRNELGGELKKVYVLFSDIRGFTQMTEKLKPQETVDVLNRMYAAMEEIITQGGGDINKYIGDASSPTSGGPTVTRRRPRKRCCGRPLRMQDRFEA